VLRSTRLLVVAGAFALLGPWANKAHAVGVAAGTSIDNTAQVTYQVGAVSVTTTSNTSSVVVAEILDVVVTLQTPSIPVVAGATQRAMLFRVSNTGNGTETFRLQMTSVLGGDDFDPTPAAPSIYFDTDASGDLSPGDVPYTAGSNDPALNADAFVTLLVINDIPAGVPVPGARINYTIVVSASGTGTATAASFDDAIPANTTYVPGTLRLNNAALSDAADADAGTFSTTPNARVQVQLGNLTQASGSQTIQFAVTIN
jgi:uncharacterized repeat protein (TIGR01451 family)